jgi:Putative peptidoglycan binding domain
MALALSAGLGAIVLAQQTAAPPPAQMQQPGPAAPGAGPAKSNRGNPEAAAPDTGTPYGQPANLSPDTVKQAQQQLKSEDLYHGAIDGRVGPATRAAVHRFQQQNGLTTNAILDQETLQRLMSDHHD